MSLYVICLNQEDFPFFSVPKESKAKTWRSLPLDRQKLNADG